jgi:hypothetical protein
MTMKRLLPMGCVFLLGLVAVLVGRAEKVPSSDDAARAAAIKLYKSLSDDQKKLALKPFEDKERYVEQFPPVKRPGLPFTKLSAEQKALVDDIVRAMTSEYGSKRCLEVAKQTGPEGRYLNFFGEPDPGQPFAWRMAQHHLTLIYAEFGTDKVNEFGPILLGGNPVKTLWDDEERIALDLYAALSPEEGRAIKGKGGAGSGAAIGDGGMRIGDLGEKARPLARRLLAQRLAVFAPDRRKVLEGLIERDGGVDNLRIAYWGDASKSQHQGGTYSWKIGSPAVLCDWQTVGKEHIHMTVRGRVKS